MKRTGCLNVELYPEGEDTEITVQLSQDEIL